jgi:hypothetical protein
MFAKQLVIMVITQMHTKCVLHVTRLVQPVRPQEHSHALVAILDITWQITDFHVAHLAVLEHMLILLQIHAYYAIIHARLVLLEQLQLVSNAKLAI